MSLTTFLIIAACVAAGYWVVSSVMSDDAGQPDRDADAPARPAARPASRPVARTAAPATPPSARPTAQPSTRPSARRDARPAQPVQKRAPARPARSSDPLSDWSVVLDVPVDAPRVEVLAAAKRRLAQARADGDAETMARITRAAQQGLGLRPKR